MPADKWQFCAKNNHSPLTLSKEGESKAAESNIHRKLPFIFTANSSRDFQ